MKSVDYKRSLKVFLSHIMPVGYAHADHDPVCGLYTRTPRRRERVARQSKTPPGQDWELEIREVVRKIIDVNRIISITQMGKRKNDLKS